MISKPVGRVVPANAKSFRSCILEFVQRNLYPSLEKNQLSKKWDYLLSKLKFILFQSRKRRTSFLGSYLRWKRSLLEKHIWVMSECRNVQIPYNSLPQQPTPLDHICFCGEKLLLFIIFRPTALGMFVHKFPLICWHEIST